MRVAAKTGLFMGKGEFAAGAAADDVYTTPQLFGPKLGTLSYLVYKEGEARIQVETDAQGRVRIMAGTVEVGRFDFNGNTAGSVALDLADVQGQTRLQFAVDVTVAGSGTGTVTGSIDIDQPAIAMTSC